MSPTAKRRCRKAVNPIDPALLILPEFCAMVLFIDAEPSPVPQGTLFLTRSMIWPADGLAGPGVGRALLR